MLWLPGWSAPPELWREIVGRLAPTRDAVTCDFSAARRPADHLEIALRALERLRSPTVVVGWSLGAMVALELARVQPARVSSLVLVGATDRFIAGEDRSGWSARVLARMRARLATDARGVVSDLDRRMFSATERARGEDESWIAARGAAIQPVAALDAGLAYLERFDIDGHAVSVPTRLLHGRDDTICPVAGAERLAQSLPRPTLTVWDDVGHLPFWTRPEAFSAWLWDGVG